MDSNKGLSSTILREQLIDKIGDKRNSILASMTYGLMQRLNVDQVFMISHFEITSNLNMTTLQIKCDTHAHTIYIKTAASRSLEELFHHIHSGTLHLAH